MMPQFGPEISRGARDKDGLRLVHVFSRKEDELSDRNRRTEGGRAFSLVVGALGFEDVQEGEHPILEPSP